MIFVFLFLICCGSNKPVNKESFIYKVYQTNVINEYRGYGINFFRRSFSKGIMRLPGGCNVYIYPKNIFQIGRLVDSGFTCEKFNPENCNDYMHLYELVNIMRKLNCQQIWSDSTYMSFFTFLYDSTYNEIKKANPGYYDEYAENDDLSDDNYYYEFTYFYDTNDLMKGLEKNPNMVRINDHWAYSRETYYIPYKYRYFEMEIDTSVCK